VPLTMTRAIYDDIAPRYDAAMRPLDRWFLSRWRAEALAHLPAASRILEVGAGTGLNFRFYPQATCGVASELSCEMLKLARHKAKPAGVVLVQNDAEQLPFADASFEAAFATLVFCSIPSPRAALAELRRVTKSGGAIVLLEHVRPAGLLGPVFDVLSFFTSRLFGDHANRRTVENVLAAGLRVERVEKKFFGVFNLIICRVK
jgi:phosphatidylethanolamine/phosphatidyl-N-methylethanolamine N-methyltransferase